MEPGLQLTDTTKKKAPRHMQPSSTDDEFETPEELFYDIIQKGVSLGEDAPDYDPFTSLDKNGRTNSKCLYYGTAEDLVYTHEPMITEKVRGIESYRQPKALWINHPHTLHKETVELMHILHKKFGYTIFMIIPSNTRRTPYWEKFIEPYRDGGDPKYKHIRNHIHNWPVLSENIRFLKDGKPSKDTSRNSYEVLIWMKKKRSKN